MKEGIFRKGSSGVQETETETGNGVDQCRNQLMKMCAAMSREVLSGLRIRLLIFSDRHKHYLQF